MFSTENIVASNNNYIYVPMYRDADTYGPLPYINVNYKNRKNNFNGNSTRENNLFIEVKAIYKNFTSKFSHKQNKVSKDWYISKYSSSKQKYLLKVRNKKIRWVRSFFHWYKSPLEKYAVEFVHASEYYNIDYRLLPAISIVESSGGKYLFRPNNPFGWGNNGYKSFKDAIWDVARGLSIYYYRFNRRTPELIGEIYNPVTPKQWAGKVRYLMNQMPRY